MSDVQNFKTNLFVPLVATITISTDTSDIVDVSGTTLVSIIVPSAITGTSLSFESSSDGVNFYELRNAENGTLISVDVSSGVAEYTMEPRFFFGKRAFRIVSNATELAERQILLVPGAI